MSRRKEIALVTAGVLAGITISGPASQATAGLMANASSQRFYVNEQRIPLEAYEINGNNYVKLRDIGQALNLGVTYDARTNTVRINPNQPEQALRSGGSIPFRTQHQSGRLHQRSPGWKPIRPAEGRCGPLR